VQNAYRLDSYEKADFYLGFNYSMGAGRSVYEPMPVYIPPETGTVRTFEEGGEKKTSFVTFPGYTTYVPQKFTIFSSSLTLEVLDAQRVRNLKEEKRVWIGETICTSQNPDLREIINYLLVAAFERFGENTGRSVLANIADNDPKVKALLR
jgi:hypothetical protein